MSQTQVNQRFRSRRVQSGVPASSARTEGWDLMLCFLAAYLLTAVGRVHQLFESLAPLHPAVLSSAGAAALFLIDRHRARRIGPSLTTPPIRFMLAFWLWTAFSVPGALNQGVAFTTFVDLGRTVALSVVMVSAVRSVRDVSRLATIYFASAVLFCIVVLMRFRLGAGDMWRLGTLYYYDSNDFATFIASAVPIGIYLLFRRGALLERAGALAGLSFLAIGVVWSGSRGGFLALLGATVFLLFRFTAVRTVWRVVAVTAFALIFVYSASDKYWDQMQTIGTPQQDYNMTGEEGRVEIWKRGIGYMTSRPLLGVGVNNFPVAEGTLSSFAGRQAYGVGVRWSAAHNSFVQAGAELGIPGLLLFIAIIVAAFRALSTAGTQASRLGGTDDDAHALTQALTGSLVGFVIGICFLSMAYHEILYCLAALAAGAQKVTSIKARRLAATPTPIRARPLAGGTHG